MPVTEFATLKFKESYTFDNEALREPFQSVAERQAAWSGYPVIFYTNIRDASLLHIVSGWKDSDAHQQWIVSEENQRYLTTFGPVLSVEGLVHVDIDFAQIPSNTQVLLYRKKTLNGDETELSKGTTDGRQFGWVGQGIDVDNPKDLYYFEAYDNFDESTNAQADGVNILRQISF